VRRGNRPAPVEKGERLFRQEDANGSTHWTVALGEPPAVYGERITSVESEVLRRWDPARSKLGAALANGWDGPIPRVGERWLYLGAATGTTSSHVADLVGPDGFVFAVEKSLRPFARLLALARRYPNLGPVLGDARDPLDYLPLVPPVDGVYVDVAQPDQVAISLENARWFLRPAGTVLLALKTASMGRERTPREHVAAAVASLAPAIETETPLGLEPFHRRHFLIAGRPTRLLAPAGGAAPTRRAAPRVVRRR
jgi:fibrillarin-like rRNA methylase